MRKKVLLFIVISCTFLFAGCSKLNLISTSSIDSISLDEVDYINLTFNLYDENTVRIKDEEDIANVVEMLDYKNMSNKKYNYASSNADPITVSKDKLKTAIEISIIFNNNDCLRFILKEDGGLFNNFQNETSLEVIEGRVYSNKIYIYSIEDYKLVYDLYIDNL